MSTQRAIERTPFGEAFFHYFDLVRAHDATLRDAAYRIRYQVYVLEMGFEKEEDCPGGRETDAYDRRAEIVLLRHRSSGRYVGCVRLILAGADPAQPFPFELASGRLLDNDLRSRIGEVSRLAVVSDFRRRKTDTFMGLGAPIPTEGDQRRNPITPAFGLVFVSAWVGLELGLEAVYTMMELRLARMLRSLGLLFTQVSDPVEYHGLRAAFRITRQALESPEVDDRISEVVALMRARVMQLR